MFNVARDNISIFGDDELLPLHNDHRSGFYTNILKYNAKKTIKMMWEKNRDDFVEYIKLNKPWYYKDICAAVFETNDNVETNNDINCCSGLPKDLLECIRQHTPIEWLITCFGSVGGISNVDIEKMIPYLPYILEDSNFDLAEHIYLTYEKVKGIPLRIGDTVYNNITGFEQFLFLLQHEKIPDDELALKLIENHPDALYDWGVMRYLVRRVRKDVIMRILDEFHGTDELTSEIVEIAQKRFPDIV
jgi:hypothetical protein